MNYDPVNKREYKQMNGYQNGYDKIRGKSQVQSYEKIKLIICTGRIPKKG